MCDTHFDLIAADVACQSLGYQSAVEAKHDAFFGRGTTDKKWIQSIDCKGTEKSLGACGHAGWGRDNMCHRGMPDDVAGVVCTRHTGSQNI